MFKNDCCGRVSTLYQVLTIALLLLFLTPLFIGCTHNDNVDVDVLIQRMNSEDQATRILAKNALVELGEPAVEPLIDALKDEYEDQTIREMAALALAEIGNERAIIPLIAALKMTFFDPELGFRYPIVNALVEFGETAVEPLINALKDRNADQDIRFRAAMALAKIGDSRAVEPLIDALEDNDSFVRSGARIALVEIGEPAIKSITAKVKDEEITVQELVVAILLEVPMVDINLVVEFHEDIVRIGEPGSTAILIDALYLSGNKEMAETFLNCGNEELESAAREWAFQNGYSCYSAGQYIPSTTTKWHSD